MQLFTSDEVREGIGHLDERLSSDKERKIALAVENQLEEGLERAKNSREPEVAEREALLEAVERLKTYPNMIPQLNQVLRETTGKSADVLAGFADPPGGPDQPQPGDKAKCPIDASHYSGVVIIVGQRCPKCNAELIPV